MNHSIRSRTSKEVKMQLKRAEVQKKILIKNIYKEYEIYYQIVRKTILASAEKGLFGLYSYLSLNYKTFNAKELTNFFNKKISLLIYSKLPFMTIEQLRLEDIGYDSKHLINLNPLQELVEFKKDQTINFDYQNDLITDKSLEFYCNNDSNKYEYYESISEKPLSSLNLDEKNNFNYFSKENSNKKNLYNKNIDSLIELKEEIDDSKLFEYDNIREKLSDVFISIDNLNFFEIIDKSFSNLLSKLSHNINLELFKIKIINKFISEEALKTLSSSNYLIKYPRPFVMKYNFNKNKFSSGGNRSFDICLFNISNVELEFSNIELSKCRNNINQLKNKLILLNKKYRYWKNKEFNLHN